MDTKILIQDLAKELAAQKSIDKKAALAFVQSFFDVILEGLRTEKYVKIKGLGTFKLVDVESRESMNIHTGERFEIQGHAKISFTPDATLKELINKPFAHFETVPLADDVTEAELDAIDAQFEDKSIADQVYDVEDDEMDSAETEISDRIVEPSTVAAASLATLSDTVSKADEATEEVKSSSAPVEVYPEVSYEKTEYLNPETEKVEEEVLSSDKPILPSENEEPATEEPTEEAAVVESVSVPEDESSVESPQKESLSAEMENAGEEPVESAPIAAALSGENITSEVKPDEDQSDVDAEEEEKYLDYIDESEEKERRKVRLYEWIFGSIFALIAMGIGYFIGYVHLASRFPNEVEVIVVDTVYVEKAPVDSTILPQTEPVIRRDETTPPLNIKTEPAKTGSQPAKPATQQTPSEKPTTQPAKPAVQPTAQPAQTSSGSDHSQYPQVSGGAYWIVGTAQTYKVRSGETIRIIAERFFGSRQMAPYIIKYNNISDPDHVAEGTVLNVQKLESKKK